MLCDNLEGWDLAQMVKHLPTMWEARVQSLGWEDLEKEMATHSSILAWKIPWMEEPVDYSPWGGRESDRTERLHFHFQRGGIGWEVRGRFRREASYVYTMAIPGLGRSPGEGNGYPLQYSCLENYKDRGAWWVHGIARSWTQLSN